MLNVNEIAARIKNPAVTNAQDAEDLKLLADKYPYTQLFSILYLQSLKQAGDVHFEDELKKHSFRITDRTQLFNLIESAHSVSAVSELTVTEDKVEEILEPPVVETTPPIEEEVEPVSELENEENSAEVTLGSYEENVSEEIIQETETSVIKEEEIEQDEPAALVVDNPQN